MSSPARTESPMPSISYRRWRTVRRAVLDLVESAHSTDGTGAGRREATRQINHGYTVLLAAEFQGFCRDLHTECIDSITASVATPLQLVLDREFRFNRSLDRGNPSAANIGSDFGRFGFNFWPAVLEHDQLASGYRTHLAALNMWRNAIAHNDFAPERFSSTILSVSQVRQWRRRCNQLARILRYDHAKRADSIDRVIALVIREAKHA